MKRSILLMLLACGGFCLAGEAPLPEDPADYVALVDYCVDHTPTCGAEPGSNPDKAWQALMTAGERAYPALADELLKTGDPEVVGVIAEVFKQSTGDKTVPLHAMKTFLELNARERPALLPRVIGTVAKTGGAAEMDFLQQFRDHPDKGLAREADRAMETIAVRLHGPLPPQVPRPARDESSVGDKAVLWAWIAMAMLVALRIGMVVYQRWRHVD